MFSVTTEYSSATGSYPAKPLVGYLYLGYESNAVKHGPSYEADLVTLSEPSWAAKSGKVKYGSTELGSVNNVIVNYGSSTMQLPK